MSSAAVYNFKKIQTIPSSADFIDIVLSKTQRKTPTVVHKHYQISRIRSFYMRKVKFTQESFEEKLLQILSDFPMLDEIHPFFSDLINVLYDRDHYKLALGQLNTAKGLISAVGRDYTRLLKFGDSLFRCKQLKKAALGRMATIMKKQKETLEYLEQVRQHLARLPSIDPSTRTLLLCGYPNVGKSSFMNKLTRAEVEVQPYAFTTKSLFVGHMDYRYLRWQVIDTPGILDHPLDERNTIEMLSITALAHLRACILYFIDVSEQCGFSIKDQVQLFKSIKPLFNNKPVVVLFSKMDVRTLDSLDEEEKELINSILTPENVPSATISSVTDSGVMEARNFACDQLLRFRVDAKIKAAGNGNIGDLLRKIHVSFPKKRDDKERPTCIPEEAKLPKDPHRKTERDLEIENGDAGVYNVDLKKKYLLENPEWQYDVIPEIMDGHNIADWIDPDIERKLDELEKEEEELMIKEERKELKVMTEEETKVKQLAMEIREKKKLKIMENNMKRGKNRRAIVATAPAKTKEEIKSRFSELGVEVENISALTQTRKRKRDDEAEKAVLEQQKGDFGEEDDVDYIRNVKQKLLSDKIKKKSQRKRNLDARKGEADRTFLRSRPEHLFKGKRGFAAQRR